MVDKPLTTFEMAKYCHVTHRAVLKWIAEGKLKSYRTPGNHSRVHKEDFVSFLNEYHMPVPEEFKGYTGGKKKILIVDDDKMMITLIKSVVTKSGDYEIKEAYDGFSAGKKFASFKPDLMTLDIQMPQLDGLEVLRNIRQEPENKSTKIIIVSSLTDPKVHQKAFDLGANDFLTKPLDTKKLIFRIKELLEK